ncbi:phosphotransferase [Aurantimonas sp. 22II-16-19i]|uniref:phosphotransferase n=1 Tax=Aurantimonas sp. 22II-16-19i TaxID=1317114 RepID=UPI0009F7DBEE|nr:phosphotransferase [Aurantimonas sp. 22II-16-19i]ORE91834.1 phosphotransferase [Aurantimonas sp. 22II-16-19i]
MTIADTADAPATFTVMAPRFKPAEITALLRDRYGIEGRVWPLASERDLTMGVEASDGRRFVLKIANSAEDPAVVRFQNAALVHIADVAPTLPVSRVVETLQGQREFVASADGQEHMVRLLTYLPGDVLADVERTATQLPAIGRLLGELSLALSSFSHPVPGDEILWDMQRAARLLSLTGSIASPDLRRQVEAILARFAAEIAPRQASLERQIVHNDFNPSNLLVAADEPGRIVGILDFGDMMEAPRIFDVAVACSYHVPAEGPPLGFATMLLSAYHAVHPLAEDEIPLLFDLIATRHAMTIAISEWRAQRHPENAAYVLRNHANAARAIGRFATVRRDEAVAELEQACRLRA